MSTPQTKTQREQPWSDQPPEQGQVVVVSDNPIGRAVVEIAQVAGRRTTLLADEGVEPTPMAWLTDHPLAPGDALVLCDTTPPRRRPCCGQRSTARRATWR